MKTSCPSGLEGLAREQGEVYQNEGGGCTSFSGWGMTTRVVVQVGGSETTFDGLGGSKMALLDTFGQKKILFWQAINCKTV